MSRSASLSAINLANLDLSGALLPNEFSVLLAKILAFSASAAISTSLAIAILLLSASDASLLMLFNFACFTPSVSETSLRALPTLLNPATAPKPAVNDV